MHQVQGLVTGFDEAIDLVDAQVLAIALMVGVRDCSRWSAPMPCPIPQFCPGRLGVDFHHTFVQVTLQFIELTLLQPDLQLNHVRRRGPRALGPFARDKVSFLDFVGCACANGRREHGLNANGGGKQGGEGEDEHGGRRLGLQLQEQQSARHNAKGLALLMS